MAALPLSPGLGRDAVAVAVTVLLAAASYWLVERPLRRRARSAHDRWRERRARHRTPAPGLVPESARSLTSPLLHPARPAASASAEAGLQAG